MAATENVAGIICHDAGGAEILASYARQQNLNAVYCLGGPAIKIFERKLGAIPMVELQAAIESADWVLCGTSWQSDLEWQALELARARGTRSVSFLDHWVNYRQRFIRHGEERLPDEIWVGDVYAMQLAREIFAGLPVVLVENPAFQDISKEISKIVTGSTQSHTGLRILFVSDNIADSMLAQYGDAHHWGYTDDNTLEYLLEHLDVFGEPVHQIRIRPHPSEPPDRFAGHKALQSGNVVIGGQTTLLEEIADSDIVAGGESMAMVIGLIAGKRVVSCIPPGGKPCALPQKEIEHMQSMVKEESGSQNAIL